jgi:hypothetical protein
MYPVYTRVNWIYWGQKFSWLKQLRLSASAETFIFMTRISYIYLISLSHLPSLLHPRDHYYTIRGHPRPTDLAPLSMSRMAIPFLTTCTSFWLRPSSKQRNLPGNREEIGEGDGPWPPHERLLSAPQGPSFLIKTIVRYCRYSRLHRLLFR